jgi:hypothetical protein
VDWCAGTGAAFRMLTEGIAARRNPRTGANQGCISSESILFKRQVLSTLTEGIKAFLASELGIHSLTA